MEPELMGRVAALTLAGDGTLAEMQALNNADPRFQVPAELLAPAGRA